MKTWILIAPMLGLTAVLAVTDSNAGPCGRDKSRNCFDLPATVNFSSVPEISKQIVIEEKIKPEPLKPPAQDSSAPYSGPTIGTNPRPGRTPTVGYHWSLE